jgi:hypothetical protein
MLRLKECLSLWQLHLGEGTTAYVDPQIVVGRDIDGEVFVL